MDSEVILDAFSKVMRELKVARQEVSNLRQQIRSLKYSQEKSIKDIERRLIDWKCENCCKSDQGDAEVSGSSSEIKKCGENITLEAIGYITTEFPLKRGIPRQPSVCPQLFGKLTISKNVFTNPEHALEGLKDYSHMWILFYFHQNESKHVPAKISPPRLKGNKIGVFATRSPHRPSPIGLSLVQINAIQDSTIYFSGIDMLDQTPVLDIKPYIPQYDDPSEIDSVDDYLSSTSTPLLSGSPGLFPGNREEPDGEDSDEDHQATATLHPLPQNVRVPSWVVSSAAKSVNLSKEAEEQLRNIGKSELKPVIQRILNEDPRSNYVKEKYSNQFYTFLISDLYISCKFDDVTNSVNVYRISKSTVLNEDEGNIEN